MTCCMHFLLIRLNLFPRLDLSFHQLPAQSIRTSCWFDLASSLKRRLLNSSYCCFRFQRPGSPSSCLQLSSFTFLQLITCASSTVQLLPCHCIYWWEPLLSCSLPAICSRKGSWNPPGAFHSWFWERSLWQPSWFHTKYFFHGVNWSAGVEE